MDKPRKKVFVCSPFRPLSNYPQTREAEKEDNLRRARQGCRMVSDLGCIPIAPHLYFPQFLDDGTEEERAIGIEMGLALLEKCDELWLFGNRITEGMKREITIAKELDIPISHHIPCVPMEGRMLDEFFGWRAPQQDPGYEEDDWNPNEDEEEEGLIYDGD